MKKTRKEQAFQTEESIIQSTKNLLKSKSFKDIQIKDICSETGISNGNFYHYFPNKSYIINNIIQDYEENFDTILQQKTETSDVDSITNLFTTYTQILQNIGKDLILEFHHFQLATKQDLLLSSNHILYKQIHKLLSSLSEQKKLHLKDTEENITKHLLIIFRGYILEWVICSREYDFIDEVKFLMPLYLSVFIEQ